MANSENADEDRRRKVERVRTEIEKYIAGGRTLVITREGEGPYVQDVRLDGATYASSWLPVSKLRAGETRLQFTMGPQPNRQRGTRDADRPPLFR